MFDKLKRAAKRQKVADYLETLLDRRHELDRQEDNIASERLFIERQIPRLRAQLAEQKRTTGGADEEFLATRRTDKGPPVDLRKPAPPPPRPAVGSAKRSA